MEGGTDSTMVNLKNVFYDDDGDELLFTNSGNANITVIIDQGSGGVTFTPQGNWNGQETITFHASDTMLETSDEVIVTVVPVNDPPVIGTPVDDFSFFEDAIDISVDLNTWFIDPDGDDLIFRCEGNEQLSVDIDPNGIV